MSDDSIPPRNAAARPPVPSPTTSPDSAPAPVRASFRARAESLADMAILSSMLQDSIVPVREMTYRSRDRKFVMIAQRYRRELDATAPDADLRRIHCAVSFFGIDAAQTHGLDRSEGGQMLVLLSLTQDGDHLGLIFAGGVTVRLRAAKVYIQAEDIGEAWPSFAHPDHADPDPTDSE